MEAKEATATFQEAAHKEARRIIARRTGAAAPTCTAAATTQESNPAAHETACGVAGVEAVGAGLKGEVGVAEEGCSGNGRQEGEQPTAGDEVWQVRARQQRRSGDSGSSSRSQPLTAGDPAPYSHSSPGTMPGCSPPTASTPSESGTTANGSFDAAAGTGAAAGGAAGGAAVSSDGRGSQVFLSASDSGAGSRSGSGSGAGGEPVAAGQDVLQGTGGLPAAAGQDVPQAAGAGVVAAGQDVPQVAVAPPGEGAGVKPGAEEGCPDSAKTVSYEQQGTSWYDATDVGGAPAEAAAACQGAGVGVAEAASAMRPRVEIPGSSEGAGMSPPGGRLTGRASFSLGSRGGGGAPGPSGGVASPSSCQATPSSGAGTGTTPTEPAPVSAGEVACTLCIAWGCRLACCSAWPAHGPAWATPQAPQSQRLSFYQHSSLD